MHMKQFILSTVFILGYAPIMFGAPETFSDVAYVTIKTCINTSKKCVKASRDAWQWVKNRRHCLAFWKRSVSVESSPSLTSKIIPLSVGLQENADCGYHAVFNGSSALAYARVHDEITDAGIEDAVWHPFDGLGYWKQYTARHCKGKTTWLDDGDLAVVARDCANIPAEQITIINNLGQFNPAFQLFDSVEFTHYINAIEKLRTVVGTSHLYVLGNMSQSDTKQGTHFTAGHWISVLAYRTAGGINYYTMDSMNGGGNEGLVEKLRYFVEQQDTATLKQEYALRYAVQK